MLTGYTRKPVDMATWTCFEEIEAWQLAREYCVAVNRLIEKSDIKKNFKLRDQMYGSSGSIMDNIAEGFERGNTREFRLFLAYSKGSAGEARSQLYRALDLGYISESEFETHVELLRYISGKIQRIIEYLNKTKYRGTRYK